MDGAEVKLKDSVYDVLLGTGIVTALNDDGSFVVAFGKRHATYQQDGTMAGVKRLYWRDPVLYVPEKHEGKKLSVIREMITLLMARL